MPVLRWPCVVRKARRKKIEREMQKWKKPLIRDQRLLIGAQEKTRTSTPLRALGPEPSASTNSATWAKQIVILQTSNAC